MPHAQPGLLAKRLARPQRVGIFGHCGVGKTTLLTVLYREAVGGRLRGVRLAAGDARTANYLAERILQLESGKVLPATRAETELRLQAYHGTTRLELLLKDYQGEHVGLDRDEPIREFLRDCDAVWLCLDAGTLADPEARVRRQQEVERLMEDYLADEARPTMERPVALVLTKADLLDEGAAAEGEWTKSFDMVRHAVWSHCARGGIFAVSSLGRRPAGVASSAAKPFNLAEPLAWLVHSLQAQDEWRLGQLFKSAAGNLRLLEAGVRCFMRRYPDAQAGAVFRDRLQALQRRRRRRRSLSGASAAACLVVGVASYDAVGYRQADRFEAAHAENPAAALSRWHEYRAWHPTRHWLRAEADGQEESHLAELETRARRQTGTERLADLRLRAENPDADPEGLWRRFTELAAEYPDLAGAEFEALRTTLQARREDRAAGEARRAFEELDAAEREAAAVPALVAQADRFLRDHPGSAPEAEVRRRREAYQARLDERDIEAARTYSAQNPLNLPERRARYQAYKDRHPTDGAFRAEAEAALKAIAAEWDRHDFRTVRDQFRQHPDDVHTLADRCHAYLAAHPDGAFRAAADELLRWTEQVTTPREYRVVLRSGSFGRSVGSFFSRGPKLSVELEVAGVRYGPSTIVRNTYEPEWKFEFPRPIRWRLGDPIRIIVTEHSWRKHPVLGITSLEGDRLAIQMLSGETWGGAHRLTFESDFVMPTLPAVD